MLRKLCIRNFALIVERDISFESGLTVITGETGAGKSIIVQALSTMTGQNMELEKIRPGAETAIVEGYFDLPVDHWCREILAAAEVTVDQDEDICMRRELHRKSRNRFLINDQLVSKNHFQQLGLAILDINSQHEHQDLLEEKHHLAILDEALHLEDKIAELTGIWSKLKEITSKIALQKREIDLESSRQAEIVLQIEEIDQADLKAGEKESLIEELAILRFAEELRRHFGQAAELLAGHRESASNQIIHALKCLQKAAQKDPNANALVAQSDSLLVQVDELAGEIHRRLGFINDSPARLDEISERLHFLQSIEGKFRNNIEGIIELRARLDEALSEFSSHQADLDVLRIHWSALQDQYLVLNTSISLLRREQSKQLTQAIVDELVYLGMENARFEVQFSDPYVHANIGDCEMPSAFSASGTDRIKFLLSANPGIPPQALSAIASGGELSRIMLALKQHLLGFSNPDTAVFDEVDAGIGGRTAHAVGKKIKALSMKKQVVCITHLPQIAAFADHHIKVQKSSSDTDTWIDLALLDDQERIAEIARMLSGFSSEPEALKHADLMARTAKNTDFSR